MKYLLAAFLFAAAVEAAQPLAVQEKGHYLRKHICGGLPTEALGPCRVYEALGCTTRPTDDDCERVAKTFLAIHHQPLPQLTGCDNSPNGETVIDFQ
mmetsp:Transcript_1124/g.2407  ORF Transcript_1124/g.2407 Transcript_1124/m.2407 type:complete len:97 (+) Transcript_1124:141-431(+)